MRSSTQTADPQDWSARRSDARRNHEKVLSAAIEVFTECGLGATMPQVAERAGVGKGTVYRSYPTKADLVSAIASVHASWLTQLITQAAERAENDAFAALHDLLHAVTERLSWDRLMVAVLPGGAGATVDEHAARRFEIILERGRQQHVLRGDVTQMDIQVLVTGIAHALIGLGVSELTVWRRYTNLVLAALQPSQNA